MNRLATRLLLAMLAVALLSLVIVPVAQSIAARRTFEGLSPEFRGRVERALGRPRPPPSHAESERPPPPDGRPMDEGFLREENLRLFTLLSDYRAAQRQAVAVGVGGAVVLSALLALLLSRTIAKPIEAVSGAASRLAGGDLGARVDLSSLAYPADETRALALNFNAMAEALERYEGERKAMIADIAHELRNPLATLQMRLDALSDGLVSFNEEEAGLLQGQVGLLARLIDDLRVLSLADAGRLSLNRLELDLGDLTGSVVRQTLPRAQQAGVALAFKPPDEAVFVDADPDRLTQVLNNLLDNALRVTPPGGKVEVGLVPSQGEVTLYVRDTGPGIPEDELGTVFERFVQGRRRDTKRETGSGLGLAIVQTLVHLHGGSVRARNHGAGALLEVALPRSKPLNT